MSGASAERDAVLGVAAASTSRRPGRAFWILSLACACQFMVILDAAIVNVALPSVQSDLGLSSTRLAWVVNGYLLTFAGFMLLGGRAADLLRNRPVLIAGLSTFSLSSLVAGLAGTSEVLIAARVTQGLGAALMAPATLAVITTTFTGGRERARAFAAWSAAGGVGGMAGALVGGALTTGLSWRFVFLINVPVGLLLIVLAATSLKARGARRRAPLDVAGAVTATAGLALLVLGTMQTADRAWSSVSVVGPLVSGLLLLLAFTVVEARVATQPMLPLRIFRLRGVALGNAMLLLFGAVAIAMWYFTSLFLQGVLGYSALRTGLAQTPPAVAFMVVAQGQASLLPRTGVRPLLLAGSACFVAGFGWLTQADVDATYVTAVLGPSLLVAVGIGLTFPTLMAAATADAPERDAGVIGGLASTTSQVGGSIGPAVLAAVASAKTGSASGARAPAELAAGYDRVFLVAAGIGLAIGAITLLLRRRAS